MRIRMSLNDFQMMNMLDLKPLCNYYYVFPVSSLYFLLTLEINVNGSKASSFVSSLYDEACNKSALVACAASSFTISIVLLNTIRNIVKSIGESSPKSNFLRLRYMIVNYISFLSKKSTK